LRNHAAWFAKENVVIGVRVKGRIEINKIDTRIRKLAPIAQPFQIVAEIEAVHSSFSTGTWTLVQRSVMALGADFLTDVLAAIVFGIIWLTLCLIAGKPMRRRTAQFQPVIPLVDGSEALLAPVEQRTLPVRISEAN
jgi:hypothetical protein